MAMARPVRIALAGGHVALVELDHPPANAMNAEACGMLLEISERLRTSMMCTPSC